MRNDRQHAATQCVALVIALLLAVTAAPAGAAAATGGSEAAAAVPPIRAFEPRRFVSRHQGTFAGHKLAYTVVAADTLLENAAGEPIGSVFSFAYLADGATPAQRPVMFIFNGGPGSSSAWLHLGGVGPRRLSIDAPPGPKPSPTRLADNPDSPLGVADLVFIDPVGTGFSRIRGKGSPGDFYGNNQDADSIAQFIERWLTTNHRWESPKFLMGESYGTVRASLLAGVLLGESGAIALRGIGLDGIVLIGHDGNLIPLDDDRRFETNLTTMAASAWYHGRADRQGRTFEQFIAAAREFATRDLGPALEAGAGRALATADLTRLSETMAGFVGLPAAYLRAKNLHVSAVDFAHDLLGDTGSDLSLYDARYVLPKRNSGAPVGILGEGPAFSVADDPQVARIAAPFAIAMHTYLSGELGVGLDEQYVLLANIEDAWKNSGPRVDSGESLVNAMRRNPALRVLFLGGWYDVVTGTIGAAEYSIAKRLPAGRASLKAYHSGHMCYLGDTAGPVGRDVSAFITAE